jgi:hypothetical protein
VGTFRLAQPRSGVDQRIEHGLQIKGRVADDLEHVGGRCLLLQRFAQLVEQASVLDCDDCLACEIRDQFYLFVCEGANLKAIDGDDADQLALPEHWNEKETSDACSNGCDYKGLTICIGFELSNIIDMRGLLGLDNACKTGTGGWLNWTSPDKRLEGCRRVHA